MKICADFNGVEECSSEPGMACLGLTGYGTLASLSFHRLRIREGETLVFCDPDGLMAHGVTYFDKSRVSEICSGWFAKFRFAEIVKIEPTDHDHQVHVCFTCRKDIKPHLDAVGKRYNENCPFCGTIVHFAEPQLCSL